MLYAVGLVGSGNNGGDTLIALASLVDAGWMAMSRDRGTASQPVDQGYGLVCDLDGRPIADAVVEYLLEYERKTDSAADSGTAR